MKEIEKNSIIKLKSRPEKTFKVLNLPTSYMSNGSYEVIHWVDNGIGEVGRPFWVDPNDLVSTEWDDDLDNYFEFIFDEEGLHIVPKNIDLIKIDTDINDSKKIVITYPDNKHKTVTLYIGDTKIIDDKELTERPEEVSLKDKITKVILGEED